MDSQDRLPNLGLQPPNETWRQCVGEGSNVGDEILSLVGQLSIFGRNPPLDGCLPFNGSSLMLFKIKSSKKTLQ